MAGFHVRAEQQRVRVGLAVAQAGDPLGRFVVLHLRIPQAGADEQGRVGLALDVVVRRVGEHVVVVLLLGRVAPFVELVRRQRDGFVQHRRDDIDEGHLRDQQRVVVRRHVRDRAHQQAAGAAAEAGDAVFRRITFLHQETGDVDEVGEGVLLLQQLAVLVPAAAHFLAAADMGDGVDHAAVEQAQQGRAETRIARNAVAAVGVLQQRRRAVLPESLAINHRHRHLGAVARRRPQAFGDVVGRIEIAEHRVALEQLALAGLDVDLVGRIRRRQRGVAVAQPVGAGLGIDAQAHRVGRLVGGDEIALAVLAQGAQTAQAAGAFVDGDEIVEQLEILDENLVVVRHQFLPARAIAPGLVVGHRHQPEVLRAPVRADHPAAVQMVGLVFEIALARRQHGEFAGLGRRRAANFAADRAADADADVLVRTRARDAHVEAVVVFLVHEAVLRGRRTQHMRLDALAQQRGGVLFDVVDRAVVVGPDQVRLDVLDAVGIDLAGAQVLHLQHVLAAADLILGPGEQFIVLAHFGIADAEIALALGHRVLVEQDLFRRIHRALAARVDRVVLAGLEARVIPVAAQAVRHRSVVLLDAADDFAVQALLQRLGRRQHGVGVGVLGLDVGQHFLVLARIVAQPVVLVLAHGAVRRLHFVRLLRRDGRRGQIAGLGAADGERHGEGEGREIDRGHRESCRWRM